jgi:GNAT superfamily N-acetyltransferase
MIRAASAADLPTLVELWLEKSMLVAQTDSRLKLSADVRSRWLSQAQTWLTNDQCGFFIAERDGRAIGYIIGWQQPAPLTIDAAYIGAITDIAIDAHGYRGGVGRALLDAVRNWFEDRGIHQLAAYVPRRYAAEQAFWRALGATEWMDLMWLK